MFTYFHCYIPKLWAGYEKNRLLRGRYGVRFPMSVRNTELGGDFNEVAKKGGELYKLIKEKKLPLYIDRLQGGDFIYHYDFDEELLAEYEELLGDDFYGFQIHEWLSNYHNDIRIRLKTLPSEEWTAENIERTSREGNDFKWPYVEAMTLSELEETGKPESSKELYDNMTAIYKRRAAKYKKLVPCDSFYLMYPFEAEQGAAAIMPEVGAQIPDMRLQMCFARGVTRAYGIKLGAYYEPWGGAAKRVTTCMYNESGKNEWMVENATNPFASAGKRGGSSRSLQFRIMLYAYLSGADFISEEWGGYNTFSDAECTLLSEYGETKKRFLDFVDKYPDIGEKISPIAVVISNDLPCYVLRESERKYLGFPADKQTRAAISELKSGLDRIFCAAEPMKGNKREIKTLINSKVPDAFDMLNEGDGRALSGYEYIVDMTADPTFKSRYDGAITPDEALERIDGLLPCRVEGGLHWMVNKRADGGYYLAVFNHSGVVRNLRSDEHIMAEETRTVTVDLSGKELLHLEGDSDIEYRDGKYLITVRAGDFFFGSF